MKRSETIFLLLLVASLSASALGAAKQEPARQILGLRLGMTEEQARGRLNEIGTFVRKETGQQEVWKVRDPRFSHILIGFAKEGKLRYVTAVAREDKETTRVSYASVGDLKEARQAGDPKMKVFNYQWTLPAEKGEPETVVIALGRDPDYLSTYSLKRLALPAAEDYD